MLLTILEWAGAIGGAAGALLLAFNNQYSRYGWVLFLVSNACWFSFGWMTGRDSMVFMQIVCTGTTSVGIWKWIILPRRAAKGLESSDMLPQRIITLAGQKAALQGGRNG